jgi:hypothetical protein
MVIVGVLIVKYALLDIIGVLFVMALPKQIPQAVLHAINVLLGRKKRDHVELYRV